jgi:thiol-disulfide isomerase/thioredoxin
MSKLFVSNTCAHCQEALQKLQNNKTMQHQVQVYDINTSAESRNLAISLNVTSVPTFVDSAGFMHSGAKCKAILQSQDFTPWQDTNTQFVSATDHSSTLANNWFSMF